MTGSDDQQYRDQPQDDRPTAESSGTEQAPGATPAGAASPAGARPAGGATPADFSGGEPTTVVPRDQLGVADSSSPPADDSAVAADRDYSADQGYPADQSYRADHNYAAVQHAGPDDAPATELPATAAYDPGTAGSATGYPDSPAGGQSSSELFTGGSTTEDDDATRTQMLPESAGAAGYRSTPAYSRAPETDDATGQSAYGADPYGSAGAGQPAPGYQQQQSPYQTQQPGGYQQQPAGGGQGFFAQQQPQVQLDPAKNRIAQNFGGGLIGLVLTLGAAALCGLLAYKLDILADPAAGAAADPSTIQQLAYYGLIAIAAVPALLAGFAPATAWVPGVVILVAALIGTFSDSFATNMAQWSVDLFGTPGMASFVGDVGIPLGFALLFAGLGAVWARKSGESSVIARISGARP